MANTLIIPGVQVSVVKDVLPQQLAPSGILGLIGFTEKIPGQVERASSMNRLVDTFGGATALSLPEARAALDNGVSELVISPLIVSDRVGSTARLRLPIKDAVLTLSARAPGPWANGLEVVATVRELNSFDLRVRRGKDDLEVFRNLSLAPADKGTDKHVETALNGILEKEVVVRSGSTLLSVIVDSKAAELAQATGPFVLAGGKDATPAEYKAAIDRLRNEADVDLVLAAISDFASTDRVVEIYGSVISHCNNMADACKGRIGLGQVGPQKSKDDAVTMASKLLSDRFVLLAPYGVVGATAGLLGNLTYFHSPTFKQVQGLGALNLKMDLEDQRALLAANVVPVVFERGRGTVVLRGLTTDGDQINVRRVADRAVRGVKMIGELFIGRLNNADGRTALKQKIIEFLLQTEKDGAIVPSTDGKDPAFKVNVYSSQDDFAKGIVRVDIAVRPVRAIDFIYATIQVQI